MTLLKEGWPCREPGCGKATEKNARYCNEHTFVRSVFAEDEPVRSAAPCPFCGMMPALRTLDQQAFFLVCGACDAHGPLVAEEDRAAWVFGFRSDTPNALLTPEARGVQSHRVEGEEAPGAGPCPFCGGSDLFFERVGKPGASLAVNSVVCRTCEAAGPAVRGGADEAVGAWNRRKGCGTPK